MALKMHFLVLLFTFILLLLFSALGEGRYLSEDQPSKGYGSVKISKIWPPPPGKRPGCKSPPPHPPPPPPPPPFVPPPPAYKACCQNSCCARNSVSFCCPRQ